MDEKNFGFDFNNDKYEDIVSSSHKKYEYEDIVSDSGITRHSSNNDFVISYNEPYDRIYRKKKHGLSGFFSNTGYKFKRWWVRLSKGKKTLFVSGMSLLLAFVIAVGWFFTTFSYRYRSITGDPEQLGFDSVIDQRVINIALFGIDTRDATCFKGNSDSIMILSLNTKTKKVKVISVMRDSFVPMEKNGKSYYGKINSAYSSGGPELAIKTLNKIFKLDISEYATVNFFGMVDIIDAVGGIEATITEDELKNKGSDHPNLNQCMQEICSAKGLNINDYAVTTSGQQHLNGVQAVAYARVRNCTSVWGTTNDFGRTDRQRYVMQQLFSKAVTMSKSQYVKLAKALIPCSETSLSYTEILNLAVNVLLHSPSFDQARIPQTDFIMDFHASGYGSVVYYDLDYASKVVHAIIYDDMTVEEYVEQYGIEKNDWFSKKGNSYHSGSTGSTASKDTVSDKNPIIDIDPDDDTSSVTSDDPDVSSTDSDIDSSDTSQNPSSSDSSDSSSSSENTSSGSSEVSDSSDSSESGNKESSMDTNQNGVR